MGKMTTDELKTPDLYYAAYLLASGQELLGTERDGRRMLFCFADSDELEELKREWLNSTGLVAAQTYAQAIRSLKALVHEGSN